MLKKISIWSCLYGHAKSLCTSLLQYFFLVDSGCRTNETSVAVFPIRTEQLAGYTMQTKDGWYLSA